MILRTWSTRAMLLRFDGHVTHADVRLDARA